MNIKLLFFYTLCFATLSIPCYYICAKARTSHLHHFQTDPNKIIWGPFTLGWVISWIYLIIWFFIFMLVAAYFLPYTNDELPPAIILLFISGPIGMPFVRDLIDKHF